MCVRFSQFTPAGEWAFRFGIVDAIPDGPPHYNAAPGQDLFVVRCHRTSGETVAGLFRWGLIPSWAKNRAIGSELINAQGETLRLTPVFSDAYRARRCLVPVDSFFKWTKRGTAMQPYAIAMRNREVFALGGLWEKWQDPMTRETLRTFAIVTTKPNELVTQLDDRMPLVLAPQDYARWLGAVSDARELIRPFPADRMMAWPVRTRVDNMGNDDVSVIAAVH
jgi:putative SOS response-associated peptidase YedK